MSARFFSVPTVDWLAPIDHSVIARRADPNARAARTMSSRGIPVAASARSGDHSAAAASASS